MGYETPPKRTFSRPTLCVFNGHQKHRYFFLGLIAFSHVPLCMAIVKSLVCFMVIDPDYGINMVG